MSYLFCLMYFGRKDTLYLKLKILFMPQSSFLPNFSFLPNPLDKIATHILILKNFK